VFLPITTDLPVVVLEKYFRSAESRQGKAFFIPITPFLATAAIIDMLILFISLRE
jgi:hypothetical protein